MSSEGFTNYVVNEIPRKSLETGRFVPIKAGIVASKKLTFKPVRFEQNVPRDSLSLHLQELPKPVHGLYYAFMHHSVASGDLDVMACALHKGVELGHRVFVLVGKCQVECYP